MWTPPCLLDSSFTSVCKRFRVDLLTIKNFLFLSLTPTQKSETGPPFLTSFPSSVHHNKKETRNVNTRTFSSITLELSIRILNYTSWGETTPGTSWIKDHSPGVLERFVSYTEIVWFSPREHPYERTHSFPRCCVLQFPFSSTGFYRVQIYKTYLLQSTSYL